MSEKPKLDAELLGHDLDKVTPLGRVVQTGPGTWTLEWHGDPPAWWRTVVQQSTVAPVDAAEKQEPQPPPR